MATLDLDQLRTFVAIAETGSFTAASEQVGKTQSAVSMQIRRLEDRLQRQLFARNGRASRLTEDGQRLLPYAEQLLRVNAETFSIFDEKAFAGTIRFGVPDDYAAFIPGILGPFSRARPLAQLEVVCEPTDILIDQVGRREVDLAIVTYVPELRSRAPTVVRREALCWVTSSRHAAERETPLPLALGAGGCDWGRSAMATLERIGRPFRTVFSSLNAAAIAAAVEAGMAISVLPQSAVRPQMRVLCERDGFPILPFCEIGLLFPEAEAGPLVKDLAAHVAHALGEGTANTDVLSAPISACA